MWKYILAHWRGEQGLLRSCLLNGVILGVVTYVVTMIAGFALVPLYLRLIRTGVISSSEPLSLMMYVGLPFRLLPLIWAVWACVGIFRCGLRNEVEQTNTKARKIGGGAAIAGAVVLAGWIGHTVVNFVAVERTVTTAQLACGGDPSSRASPKCEAYLEQTLREARAARRERAQ